MLVESVKQVATAEELLPLVRKIAVEKAIDRRRNLSAAKRGKGEVVRLIGKRCAVIDCFAS